VAFRAFGNECEAYVTPMVPPRYPRAKASRHHLRGGTVVCSIELAYQAAEATT
jgi:hypothetical protein